MAKARRATRRPAPRADAEPPPPFRPVHLVLGILALGSAVLLWLIAEPAPGEIALWYVAALVGAGLGLSAYGLKRMRDPAPKPSRLDQLHPKLFFLDTWKQMDEEARAERLARKKEGKGYDWHPLVVLAVGAVCLTLMEYWGDGDALAEVLAWLHDTPVAAEKVWLRDARFGPLSRLTWWAAWRVLGYFLLPAVAVWAMRERIRDYGLATTGFREHAWVYGFAYSIVLVCVVIVSYTHEFSSYYPFYKLSSRSWAELVAWELLYAAQFFSLEFFFRGWWLQACKRTMGSHAIFAMVVPYCMIHFGKPMPEAIAAIVAGVVLGTLAMKTRSIWSGFLIHVSVAVSMDIAALLQTTGLPDRWWPLLP